LNLELLSNILGLIGIGSSIFPILIFFKLKLFSEKLIFIFSLELFFINITTFLLFLFSNYNKDSLIFWHVFISSLFLNFIYIKWGKAYKFFGYLNVLNILICVFVFVIIYSIDNWNIESKLSFYSTLLNFSFSLLSIYAIIVCYNNSQFDSLFKDKFFVLSAAILVYFGLQQYVISYETIIRKENDYLFFLTWPIIQISTILYHLLIAKSIWNLRN